MTKRAMCLWLPQWPLQRLRARLTASDAHEAQRPVVLYVSRAGQSPRVAHYAASLAAAAAEPWLNRRAGIRADMPLVEARALIASDAGCHGRPRSGHPCESKPDLETARVSLTSHPWHPEPNRSSISPPSDLRHPESSPPLPFSSQPRVEPADPLADRAELETLAQWCQRFSPTVALDDGSVDEEPESLLVDIGGLGELFGGEPALADEIVRAFAQRQLAVRVAMADTYSAAWALVHFAPLELAEETSDPAAILAALATPLIVPPGETTAAIGPLSIEALRLPADTCALLNELGLARIEQLLVLRRATLRSRFGPGVLDALDRATGAAAEALDAQAAPPEWEFQHLLEYPTARQEMIEWVLEQLIERACRGVAADDRGLVRFECRFESEDRSAASFVVGLYRASVERQHLRELVRLKLERLRLRHPVSAIRLSVLATDRLERRQQEMFAPEEAVAREAPREVAALVDRLSNRLGSRSVLGVRPMAGALPEFACRYEPISSLAAARRRKVGVFSKSKVNKTKPQPPETPRAVGDRPLYLESRPVAISVVSVAPEGPPMQFRLGTREHRTSRVWGPERIETAWWRTRCVRRDYYQVETGTGQRFWMFRHLASGRWFLHGEFL